MNIKNLYIRRFLSWFKSTTGYIICIKDGENLYYPWCKYSKEYKRVPEKSWFTYLENGYYVDTYSKHFNIRTNKRPRCVRGIKFYQTLSIAETVLADIINYYRQSNPSDKTQLVIKKCHFRNIVAHYTYPLYLPDKANIYCGIATNVRVI